MFWDKSVGRTQFCEKAFVVSQKSIIFALRYKTKKQNMNNKENKEFVMPNGFKITGNINYYTKRKLEDIASELDEIPHEGHSVGGNIYYGRAEKVHTRQRWEVGKNAGPRRC